MNYAYFTVDFFLSFLIFFLSKETYRYSGHGSIIYWKYKAEFIEKIKYRQRLSCLKAMEMVQMPRFNIFIPRFLLCYVLHLLSLEGTELCYPLASSLVISTIKDLHSHTNITSSSRSFTNTTVPTLLLQTILTCTITLF